MTNKDVEVYDIEAGSATLVAAPGSSSVARGGDVVILKNNNGAYWVTPSSSVSFLLFLFRF